MHDLSNPLSSTNTKKGQNLYTLSFMVSEIICMKHFDVRPVFNEMVIGQFCSTNKPSELKNNICSWSQRTGAFIFLESFVFFLALPALFLIQITQAKILSHGRWLQQTLSLRKISSEISCLRGIQEEMNIIIRKLMKSAVIVRCSYFWLYLFDKKFAGNNFWEKKFDEVNDHANFVLFHFD